MSRPRKVLPLRKSQSKLALARLADLGGMGLPGSADDFDRLITDETEKWAKVVKLSGAKPD